MQSLRLTIPQPDGQHVPIPLQDFDHASKSLGVFSSPSNSGVGQVDAMKVKGLTWAAKASSSPLRPRELSLQLYPSMFFGSSCISADPHYLDEAINSVYYQALSSLGVNRHITREFRTLPPRYQGLGLREPNLEALSAKIRVLHRHLFLVVNARTESYVNFCTT